MKRTVVPAWSKCSLPPPLESQRCRPKTAMRLQNSSMPPIKMPDSFPPPPRASATPSTSALELLRERRPHECDGFLARPLGGTREITDLATGAIDQDRGRQ